MKAILERDGGLVWADVDDGVPGPGEVRIRVRATAVNRADLVQRSGRYPPPPGASPILGLEAAGVVDAVGPGCTERAVGDEVIALLSGGGYAEAVVCPEKHTLPRPPAMSWEEAASLMEVTTTAWLNLAQEASLQPGERVLIHAGASGVGITALQLCAHWGCPTFATVGSAEKQARCEALGAVTHNRHQGPWREAVEAWGGADVVLCPVGGAYLNDNISVLRGGGRLVLIGLMGGAEGSLPLGRLLVKRLSLRGSVLRSRSRAEKDTIVQALGVEVAPLWDRGVLRPEIHAVFPLQEAEQAHTLLASNGTIGKIVLAV